MKINELFLNDDVRVNSSWINTLDYQNGSVIMKLDNGASYIVMNVPPETYDRWLAASSKGEFWHINIKPIYKTSRHF